MSDLKLDRIDLYKHYYNLQLMFEKEEFFPKNGYEQVYLTIPLPLLLYF